MQNDYGDKKTIIANDWANNVNNHSFKRVFLYGKPPGATPFQGDVFRGR